MSSDTLEPVTGGIWRDTAAVHILGTQMTASMVLVRLEGDELLLYSPLALTEERRAAVDNLGKLSQLYAPNLYHHMWLGQWAEAYPDACVHGPRGLGRKRPDLRLDRVHGSAPSPLPDWLEELPIEGFRLRESALFCHPARTLLVADLVQNVGKPTGAWSSLYSRLMGFHDRVALSRAIRWLGFSDRGRARASVDRILELPVERIVVGHGAPVTKDAKRALYEAFRWLGPSQHDALWAASG